MARVPPRSTPPPPRGESDLGIEPTIVSARADLNLPEVSPDQTIISTPGRRRTSEDRTPPRSGTRQTASAPSWTAARMAIAAALLLALIGGAVLVALLLSSAGRETGGLLLSVIKPANGTVVGHGINCGTRGTQCTVTLAGDTPVALRLVPDEGFAPGGYTEDCPAAGQFLMTAPRTCGALFVRLGSPPVANGRLHTLTIFATEGGVVRVGATECRLKSGGCAIQVGEGEVVDLESLADKGYTFERFTGACDADGRVTMSEPKTCGASFVSRIGDGLPSPPPPIRSDPSPGSPAPPRGGSGSASGKPSPQSPPGGAAIPGTPVVSGGKPEPAGVPVGPGSGSAATPGTPAAPPASDGPAPPPPPPPKSDEEQAKQEITDVIESYRKATEARDFPAIRRVYPTAPDGIASQWRFIKTLKLEKSGEPEIKPDLQAGTATAVVGWNRTTVTTLGQKGQGLQKVTLQLHRKTANNNWVISSAKFES
jgi:hypothetical protein